MEEIRVITLPMPLRMGTVNCFLVETSHGFVLIDTGPPRALERLETELASAGCRPGNLNLIILTHGDFDHTGNAAYLRDRFESRIAMHQDDIAMAERGDMFSNRSSGNAILRSLTPIFLGFAKANRFTPDFTVSAGDELAEYGLDARILCIPGHSKGSIGILTASGNLFCGDLLENTKKPAKNSIMDDETACEASIERLEALSIETVYPGHGDPFAMEHLAASHQESNQSEGQPR